MAVVRVINGVVVQTWQDVENVAAAVEKYGLNPADLVDGDHPPGTEYDGNVFTTPVRTPNPTPASDTISEIVLAIRDLADDLGPQHAAKMNARFGPRP